MFSPHLACDVNLEKLVFPVAVMPKLDGNRMLCTDGKATGRSLKAYKNKALTEHYSKPQYSGIDGELCDGDLTDSDLCRKTTSCVNKITGHVPQWWAAFDYNTTETEDMGFVERHALLTKAVENAKDFHIIVVDYEIIEDMPSLLAFYDKALLLGYEGVVLRSLDGKHKDGRCTENQGSYMRLKPSADAEAIVVGLQEAMENQNEAKTNELGHTERSTHKANMVGKGMIGALLCEDCTTGLPIKLGPGKMTHKEREYFWLHPELIIGTMAKYRSLQTGVKNAPRHARVVGGEYLTLRVEEDMIAP